MLTVAVCCSGSAGHNTESESGSCHIKLPRVDLVVEMDEPWKPRQTREPQVQIEAMDLTDGATGIEEIPIIKQQDQSLADGPVAVRILAQPL